MRRKRGVIEQDFCWVTGARVDTILQFVCSTNQISLFTQTQMETSQKFASLFHGHGSFVRVRRDLSLGKLDNLKAVEIRIEELRGARIRYF